MRPMRFSRDGEFAGQAYKRIRIKAEAGGIGNILIAALPKPTLKQIWPNRINVLIGAAVSRASAGSNKDVDHVGRLSSSRLRLDDEFSTETVAAPKRFNVASTAADVWRKKWQHNQRGSRGGITL